MEIKKKTMIKNRYEILELLGQGGFGATYRAIDHLLNRYVAIKCSDRSLSHEAKILKALKNVPNISHIYDYFVIDKTHFIVMRLIKGKSLEVIRKENGGSIGIAMLKEMLPSVLITLDQMHERGIIHRDISPGNFIVGEDDRCFLIDFDSATSIKESGLFNKQIFSHKGLDAPENYNISEQGNWTDIYSLCVTIVYLLTGEGIPAPADRVVYDPVPGMLTRLSLTAKMQNALVKGMSIDRNKRYKSVQDFSNDFFGRKSKDSDSVDYSSFSVHYHARTDIGTRNVNQDNFMVDSMFVYAAEDCEIKGYIECEPDRWHMVAVADGVAMSNHGELASKATIQAVSHFKEQYQNNEGLHENLIEEFLDQLNEKIISLSKKIGKTASTLSIIMWKNNQYCVANIGDSPIFRVSNKKLEKLSEEHTVAREKIDKGIVPTPQELHSLSRYLGKNGVAGSQMATIKSGEIMPGDIFLVCTDGIAGSIPDNKIKKYMQMDGDKAVKKIFDKAIKNPKMDNCTAIILKF